MTNSQPGHAGLSIAWVTQNKAVTMFYYFQCHPSYWKTNTLWILGSTIVIWVFEQLTSLITNWIEAFGGGLILEELTEISSFCRVKYKKLGNYSNSKTVKELYCNQETIPAFTIFSIQTFLRGSILSKYISKEWWNVKKILFPVYPSK